MFGKNSYKIEYSDDAIADLSKIPKSIKLMIKKAIEERLITYPESYGKFLKYQFKNHRSLRISKYRIIYFVKNETVYITAINHRKDVYK